jgi:hypothetical protein
MFSIGCHKELHFSIFASFMQLPRKTSISRGLFFRVQDTSQSIVSVIPGDFDGDGYNDIAVVTDSKGYLETYILWTNQVLF